MKAQKSLAKASRRCDAKGRAFKGSQLQLQVYVNRHRETLEAATRAALPALPQESRIDWVSPIEEEAFREYRDAAFLAKVNQAGLARDLARFWPARGPVWDGLAIVHAGHAQGVLLVEGKGYPAELYGGGCKATSIQSRRVIERALEQTQRWLGLPIDASRWMGSLYQSANRLAHLHFLRRQGVDAWLLHVCFLNDETHVPVDEDAWRLALEEAHKQLGVVHTSYAGTAFLPACTRAVLLESRHSLDLG